MSRDLNDLTNEMRTHVDNLLEECRAQGYEMRPYFTLRTAQEQAQLWRQSRTNKEITQKIQELQSNGAPFLADVIQRVGDQNGPKVTNAIPGLSWHQWGEAMDCF